MRGSSLAKNNPESTKLSVKLQTGSVGICNPTDKLKEMRYILRGICR